jgi:hypothetical protein
MEEDSVFQADSSDQSPNLLTIFWAAEFRVKSNPQRCPIDPDSTAYGEVVRVMLHGKRHGKYRVLFTVRGDIVHVLTVRHSARQSLADEGDDNAEEQPDSRH